MISIKINGKKLEVPEGTTVLRAAAMAGITIPTLCDHPDLTPYGGCRLCIVDVKGMRLPQASCTLPVSDGMVVRTETRALAKLRRMVLELLLYNYVDAGYAAGDRDETEFTHWVKHYKAQLPEGLEPTARYAVDSDPNPFVWVDLNKCILCSRCIRACAEVQGRFVWGLSGRGFNTRIAAGLDTTMLEARCESCGACSAFCPTGALDDKMSVGLGKPDKVVTTTCAYCGVGCQLNLNVKDNKIIRVTSNPTAPVNGMALCVKGRYGYDFVHHPDRLTRPLVRARWLDVKQVEERVANGSWHVAAVAEKRTQPKIAGHNASRAGKPSTTNTLPGDTFIQTDWDTALDVVARKFAEEKQANGGAAFAVLASAKCTNEENYLFSKFTRQVLGTNSIDHCARL
jgi:predicted molibdopterin-dependent oxidoreductase YjgC